ncbi:hypothetical protein HG537_0C04010 [Torulaspora globosa]|uniref:Ams2/SPT21 N-terminal domain-containing protein n=1 Tax=Torulaspora globosa TaxID=48254 RepID=A0A7H9HTR8_9SACH|nr:hypothetical protein HG537_0C04010 [Torulaspora sp. CBS 2947]
MEVAMTETCHMNLKILYTLDNGSSGTYLARSKKPQRVMVVSIPHPSSCNENETANFTVGAVDLWCVLQEIYLNSPELLNHNVAKSGHDYNLYYRDICEIDEPLVSLGLLSQIRLKLRRQLGEETGPNEEYDEDEPFLVTGRVCSNFAALLKRSYSNMAAKNPQDHGSSNTLEVKLRFIRVITQKECGRPNGTTSRHSITVANQQPTTHTKSSNAARSSKIRPVKNTVIKRQMNQTPAQKAERTQSLPIWNPKQASNTAFPANSIAHKIYLADRKTDASQQNCQQPLAYQVDALQQDNTIQRFKVDDSVSKRFDFMLNKKKSNDPSQSKAQQATRKPLAAKARRFNTMASIPVSPTETKESTMKENPKKQQRSGSVCDENVPVAVGETDSIINELLTTQSNEKAKDLTPTEENKENQPPLHNVNEGFDLDLLPFADINTRSDLEWFGDFNPFNSPSLNLNVLPEQGTKPSGTTPKDPNTCNTVSIENADDDDQTKLTSDIDRTSPIDTLSMPLMELNDRSTTRLVSCHEQLRRLPLLSHQLKTDPNSKNNQFPEAEPPIVIQLSSSCQKLAARGNNDNQAKAVATPSSPPSVNEFHSRDDCNDDEDEINTNVKRQRVMPSSPATAFNYQDEIPSTDEPHDLFSSFIRSRPNVNNEADSTPATQYENYSNDNTKAQI